MTVTSTTSSNQYTGTGSTGPFAYSFRITDATQLLVTLTSTAGVTTTLTYLTDYTVTGVGLATGSVTTTAAVASGAVLTLTRVPALTQTTSLRNQGAYYPAVVEDALDTLTFISQYLYALITTAIRLPASVVSGAFSAILPVSPASGYLRINAAGTAYEAVTNVNDPGTWTQSGTGAVSRTVTAKFGEQISVKDFGAKGDGATDDTTAIQNCINAVNTAGGGEVFFPTGTYVVTSSLNLDDMQGITLMGPSGATSGTVKGARILFTGTSTRLLSCRSTGGITIANLFLHSNNAGATGYLVSFEHSAAATDSFNFVVRNCTFLSLTTITAALFLDRSIIGSIRDCEFVNGSVAILGRTNAASYVNSITIQGVAFLNTGTIAIRNMGQGWMVQNVTFEQLASGAAGGIDYTAGAACNGCVITGCWFGDGNTTGTWVKFLGNGLSMIGNYLTSGAVGVEIGTGSLGCYISSDFETIATNGIKFNGVCTGMTITGCTFVGMTTPISGDLSTYAHVNYSVSGNYGVVDTTGALISSKNATTGSIAAAATFTITTPTRRVMLVAITSNSNPNKHWLGTYQTDGAGAGTLTNVVNTTGGDFTVAATGIGILTVTNATGGALTFTWGVSALTAALA